MIYEYYQEALNKLQYRIEAYADLLVTFAMKIQTGQEMVVRAPLEAADFVRLVVRRAYAAGAARVTCVWDDDTLDRINLENLSDNELETVPAWKRELYNGLSHRGAAFLTLLGTDPDNLNGIDASKNALQRRAMNTQCAEWRHNLDFGKAPWTIASVPITKWAAKVFPEKDGYEAMLALWEAILDASRVSRDRTHTAEQTKANWEAHTKNLIAARDFLNKHHFCKLHYTASNGTDLYVGLNEKSLWATGPMVQVSGPLFYPNIPTEEVFSSPCRSATHGVVHSALPLVHGGSTVRDFWFRFEEGRVIDYGAQEGKDILTEVINLDDAAHYLGECALISKNTPIKQSGLLYYETLYDENASCHLALGRGFAECIEGGITMSEDELLAAGVNVSAQHVDFMVGTDDLNIIGTTDQGEEVPIFVQGQWAWE